MADTFNYVTAPAVAGGNAPSPCPITKLAPELRQMIYDYYFEGTQLPTLPEPGTSSDLFDNIEHSPTMILKHFFNLLHYSARVRTENCAYDLQSMLHERMVLMRHW